MKKLVLILCLLASTAFAGGLYDETRKPIAGEVVSYLRMPLATIDNPYVGFPSINMVTEKLSLYPDGSNRSEFVRRISVAYTDFYGKKFPLYDPYNGSQLGTVDGDTLYALVYSTWVLGEKNADGLVRFKNNNPEEICYVTNKEDVNCP